jgi:hypothetical protein
MTQFKSREIKSFRELQSHTMYIEYPTGIRTRVSVLLRSKTLRSIRYALSLFLLLLSYFCYLIAAIS